MRKLTSERNEQIAKRFKQGASEETLAAEYDIGLTYIRTILREQGLIKKKPREDLNNRNQAVRDMFRKGNTPEQIAEEMELTTTRIRQIIQEDSAAAMEMRQEGAVVFDRAWPFPLLGIEALVELREAVRARCAGHDGA